MKLIFGFQDVPYSRRLASDSPISIRRRRGQATMTKARASYGQGKSTGQVAEELEKQYHIVETFYNREKDYIMGLLHDTLLKPVVQVAEDEQPQLGIPQDVLDKIVTRFKTNLSRRKYDGVIPGVPTRAAQRGVSHFYAHPYAQGRASRPSFIDTGMYQSTFKAWMED